MASGDVFANYIVTSTTSIQPAAGVQVCLTGLGCVAGTATRVQNSAGSNLQWIDPSSGIGYELSRYQSNANVKMFIDNTNYIKLYCVAGNEAWYSGVEI